MQVCLFIECDVNPFTSQRSCAGAGSQAHHHSIYMSQPRPIHLVSLKQHTKPHSPTQQCTHNASLATSSVYSSSAQLCPFFMGSKPNDSIFLTLGLTGASSVLTFGSG